MDNSYYAIETIVTLLSLRDAIATKQSNGGRRVRHYALSKETEQAVDMKKRYLAGEISGADVVEWCYRWIDSHEYTDEEMDYLKKNQYLEWLKGKCTKGG